MQFDQLHIQTNESSLKTNPLERFLSNLKRTHSEKTIALHQKRLQFLAQNFDPFQSQIDDESKQILAFYKLESAAQDPFNFTNLVLQMLDALEERSRGKASV